MAMILEITEDFVMQEYFDDKGLHGPSFVPKGTRGFVKGAGCSTGIAGVTPGEDYALLQIINRLAEYEMVIVPLSNLRIVYDRKNMPHERQANSLST